MKLPKWLLVSILPFILIIGLLFTVATTNEDDEELTNDIEIFDPDSTNLSSDVLKYQSLVEKYCKQFKIPDQVSVTLAIMQVESGGKGNDVMQSSESLNQKPNSLKPEASIKQGVKYFADIIKQMKATKVDLNAAIQSYNYGGAFIDYVANHGKKYTQKVSNEFAKEKSGGKKVNYDNPVAKDKWRYAYGNMYYATLVNDYLNAGTSVEFNDQTVQKIMNEALKYKGRAYVFGGSNPSTGFDCSGFTQWNFNKAGISLPRTAQAQYNAMKHLKLKDAKPGDLVFFHSTYNTADYVTHVGIYVGQMKMFHAGDPIDYANLKNSYWQSHLIGAGRIKK